MAIDRARTPKREPRPDEVRCDCGRLLARRVPGGIELCCGRCKERFFVALNDEEAGESLLHVEKIA